MKPRELDEETLTSIQENLDGLLGVFKIPVEEFEVDTYNPKEYKFYKVPKIWRIAEHAVVSKNKIYVNEKVQFGESISDMISYGIRQLVKQQLQENILLDIISFYNKYIENDYEFTKIQKAHLKEISFVIMRNSGTKLAEKDYSLFYTYIAEKLFFWERVCFVFKLFNDATLSFIQGLPQLREVKGVSLRCNFNTEKQQNISVNCKYALLIMSHGATEAFVNLSDVSISCADEDVILSKDHSYACIMNPCAVKGVTMSKDPKGRNLFDGRSLVNESELNYRAVILKCKDIKGLFYSKPLSMLFTSEGEQIKMDNYAKLPSLIPKSASVSLNLEFNKSNYKLLKSVHKSCSLSCKFILPSKYIPEEEKDEKYTKKILKTLTSRNLRKIEMSVLNYQNVTLLTRFCKAVLEDAHKKLGELAIECEDTYLNNLTAMLVPITKNAYILSIYPQTSSHSIDQETRVLLNKERNRRIYISCKSIDWTCWGKRDFKPTDCYTNFLV